jgi:hypothetical protein
MAISFQRMPEINSCIFDLKSSLMHIYRANLFGKKDGVE